MNLSSGSSGIFPLSLELVIGTYGPTLKALSEELETLERNQHKLADAMVDHHNRTVVKLDSIKKECDAQHARLFTLDTTGPRALVDREYQLLSEIHAEVLNENRKYKQKLAERDRMMNAIVILFTVAFIFMFFCAIFNR